MHAPREFSQYQTGVIGVLASGLRSASPMRDLLRCNPDHLYFLALLEAGDGLSPRRTPEPTLYKLVLPDRSRLPPNVFGVTPSLDVDRNFLSGIEKLIWYFDPMEPYEVQQTAANSCALNAMLAIDEGIPTECRDLENKKRSWPFDFLTGDRIRAQLSDWYRWHHDFTAQIQQEGLRFTPGWCDPLICGMNGGGIDAGKLAISMNLVRHIEGFRRWCDDLWGRNRFTHNDEAIANRELDAIADQLRRELGAELPIKIEYLEDYQ